jgi:hypothetical protein
MSTGTRGVCLVGLWVILCFAGCNKALNYEKTVTMDPGEMRSFPVDAPRANQKVTVTFTSSVAPVDVYIVLDKDLELVSREIKNYKSPGAVLNKIEKAREGSVSADIPAKNAFAAIVAGSTKETSVQLKITGK